MYKGNVKLTAKLTDNTISFAAFRFTPALVGVDEVELEALLGERIAAAVKIPAVATPDEGRLLARSAVESALNRLAYFHQIVIEPAQITASDFTSVQPAGGGLVLTPSPAYLVFQGQQVRLVMGISAANLKAELEPATHPGEHNFAALRSARLSTGPVEEFMHLYAILLELFGDSQNDVDAFIRTVQPNVPQAQHPKKAAGVMETVYTRLRNELAHRRPGANIEQTKKDMAARVGDLRSVIKEAIRQRP